jgi:hypothetical protein
MKIPAKPYGDCHMLAMVLRSTGVGPAGVVPASAGRYGVPGAGLLDGGCEPGDPVPIPHCRVRDTELLAEATGVQVEAQRDEQPADAQGEEPAPAPAPAEQGDVPAR